NADELLLATDEDREGEAIAWHLLEVLKPKVPVRRMVFHEITRDAIEQALAETRDVDERLVDAQVSRRILGRLYGDELAPGHSTRKPREGSPTGSRAPPSKLRASSGSRTSAVRARRS